MLSLRPRPRTLRTLRFYGVRDSTRCLCFAVALQGRQVSVLSNAFADALERPSTQSDKTVGIAKMKLQHSNMSLSHGILEFFQQ